MLFNDDFPARDVFDIDDFTAVDVVDKAETRSQRENSLSGQAESNEVSCNTNLSMDAISDIVFDSCINDYKDMVNLLSSKVKHEDQFFLTVRRNAPFSRVLSLWKR